MPKKSKSEQVHKVLASLDNWEVTRRESAIRFEVYHDGEILGKLKVGRGSISWKPARKWKGSAIILSWPGFDTAMKKA